ncbi:MAG TPA: glycosyltransferase family 4 protein [Candidatus Saccharimonadales bacterium]|nr:glycosyltransferase family 4 protein [Candidatus Saccharimonadales bacterium]
MKIVAFNWRDPAHPEAGGAELHLSEILTRAARDGDEVTWLAEQFPGSKPEEDYRGIRILRRGSWYNAHLALGELYRRRLRGERFDLVLEDINKVPFFTPRYVDAPVLAVVPHLFGATVFHEASPLVGAAVWAHESLIPHVYRDVPFLAISESTRDDLVRRGIARERIDVVRCGLDQSAYGVSIPPESRQEPIIAFVGRLRKYKGAQIAIRALPHVIRRVPEARLEIVGDGPYREPLKALARRLKMRDRIEFLGPLLHRYKVEALNQAMVAVAPSPKEGWGLTVIEANACGTPVVASRSPGLIESVRDGETGILVPHGDVKALADAIADLLTDRPRRLAMAAAGLRWAHEFTWERCYRESRAVMERAAGVAVR